MILATIHLLTVKDGQVYLHHGQLLFFIGCALAWMSRS